MLGYMLHFLGKIRWILFVYSTKSRTFAPVKHRGVEQLVARWAHNPKVIRSSRISATKEKKNRRNAVLLFYDDSPVMILFTTPSSLSTRISTKLSTG